MSGFRTMSAVQLVLRGWQNDMSNMPSLWLHVQSGWAGRRHAKHEGHIHRTHKYIQIQLWNVRWGKAINTSKEWRGLLRSLIEQLHHIQSFKLLSWHWKVSFSLDRSCGDCTDCHDPTPISWRICCEKLCQWSRQTTAGQTIFFVCTRACVVKKHFEAVANCTFSKSLWQVRIGNIAWHFIRLYKQMMKLSEYHTCTIPQEPLNDCSRTSRVSRPVKEAMLPKVASSITKPQTWDCNRRVILRTGAMFPFLIGSSLPNFPGCPAPWGRCSKPIANEIITVVACQTWE